MGDWDPGVAVYVDPIAWEATKKVPLAASDTLVPILEESPIEARLLQAADLIHVVADEVVKE